MQRRILIIDDHDDLASALGEVFSHVGHDVRCLASREEAIKLGPLETFDIVISDLDVRADAETAPPDCGIATCLPNPTFREGTDRIKVFKLCAALFRQEEFVEEELRQIVATVLDYKIRFVDKEAEVQRLVEHIEFELPSVISLMHIVLEYLMRRVEKLGVVKPEQSNLFVALDEAFVNAVKHGNKFDAKKIVRIAAEISPSEAKFTVEDEGEGFDVNTIPDPLDPQNLFKTSGRGVLFIYNIMDEVSYNSRGNRLTMVKRSDEHPA
ncbi:MAG: anti-sigma regulatory factor [Acidobacteria bacterium OLB17]|nr:MAG: anti-sigma regulatory factor [Acidobacteria bacterium OLB17]MCZ2391103.1 ATP-binding protein [Acidobacteriota bacterium]